MTSMPTAAGDQVAIRDSPDDPRTIEVDGLFDRLEQFLGRFISYPSDAARVAHTLWIAHTWLMDQWESTPRIAFLSPEPGSGKTRALEVTEHLVPRAVHAVNTTPAYLFRKVSDAAGPPTILYDEIDTVFGPRAKDSEDIRGMLNAGHRRGATAGRCVVRGNAPVQTEELPAYCAVALAGLHDVPDTIVTRSVVVRMRRRAPGERVEPWRERINRPQAEPLAAELAAWSRPIKVMTWPDMPDAIQDRDADVWEPLIAVADLAGGHWPERARVAAVALVARSLEQEPSIGMLLLRDLKRIFAGYDRLTTASIVEALEELPESPWNDLHGRGVDSRWLSRELGRYGVGPQTFRIGKSTPRGYLSADLSDAWTRYVEDTPNVAPIDVGDVATVAAIRRDGNGAEAARKDQLKAD